MHEIIKYGMDLYEWKFCINIHMLLEPSSNDCS